MNVKIDVPNEEIAGFCQRHHIRKLALFGSVLRDDFTPESDVDVLVRLMEVVGEAAAQIPAEF